MENRVYGTKWMTAYTVLFVIKIIGTIWSQIGSVITFFNNNLTGNTLATAIVALGLVELIFDIVAFVFFFKQTELGYYLNIAFLILSIVFASLGQIITNSYPLGSIMIAGIGLLLIWSLPNYIYFMHRKYLFTGTLRSKQNETLSISNISTMPSTDEDSSVKESEVKMVDVSNTNDKKAIPALELKQLKALYDDGILTEEEFKEKKRHLLGL